MTPIERLTTAQAMRLLKIRDIRTFKKYAQLFGFIEYPGLSGRITYDLTDITRKWNKSLEQKQRKKRGAILI